MKTFSRRKFTELLALGALAGCTTPPPKRLESADWTLHSPDRYGEPSDAIIPWRLVARSDLIVRGILDVPSDAELASARSADEEILIPLSVTRVFKGQALTVPNQLKYWPERSSGPSVTRLIALRGRSSAMFLALPNEDPDTAKNFFFEGIGDSALLPADAALDEALTSQVAQQDALSKAVVLHLSGNVPTNNGYIAALVEKLLIESTAYDASKELLSLGLAHAAAMVNHMDDRRPIAVNHIEVPTPPGFFESIAQYGPETVLDIVSVALGEATNDWLGNTANGGSERARQKVVYAWRVWLGRSLRLQVG